MTRIERLEAIEQAAAALIAAIDHRLDTKPWPFKYGVPFGEAYALRQALNQSFAPEPVPLEMPRGPRR